MSGPARLRLILLLILPWWACSRQPTLPYRVIAKQIPIPLLYSTTKAGAIHLSEDRLRLLSGEMTVPEQPLRDHFLLVGVARSDGETLYVMELDGVYYLEQAELVEPVLHAMHHLHTGRSGERQPDASAVIQALPDDFQARLDLARRIKKMKIR